MQGAAPRRDPELAISLLSTAQPGKRTGSTRPNRRRCVLCCLRTGRTYSRPGPRQIRTARSSGSPSLPNQQHIRRKMSQSLANERLASALGANYSLPRRPNLPAPDQLTAGSAVCWQRGAPRMFVFTRTSPCERSSGELPISYGVIPCEGGGADDRFQEAELTDLLAYLHQDRALLRTTGGALTRTP